MKKIHRSLVYLRSGSLIQTFIEATEIQPEPQWQPANVFSFHPVLLIMANLKECFIVAPLQYEKYLTFERSLFQHSFDLLWTSLKANSGGTIPLKYYPPCQNISFLEGHFTTKWRYIWRSCLLVTPF
jgi:hypothetical protein